MEKGMDAILIREGTERSIEISAQILFGASPTTPRIRQQRRNSSLDRQTVEKQLVAAIKAQRHTEANRLRHDFLVFASEEELVALLRNEGCDHVIHEE